MRFIEAFSPSGLDPASVTPAYGLAESVLAATIAQAREDPGTRDTLRLRTLRTGGPGGREVVSCGTAVTGMAVRVVGTDNRELPEDKEGHLQLRGTSLGRYLGESIAAPSEWWDTGDTGLLHQGELYVTGRVKELVIVRGRNYAPHALEEAVEQVPAVRSGGSVVTNVSQPDGTEKLAVLAEVKGDNLDTDHIQALVKERLRSAYSLEPDVVKAVPPGTVPRTTSGKRQRVLVRRMLEET